MLLLLALSGASAIWLFLQGKKPESQPDVVSQLTTPKPTATPTSVPTSTPAPFTPTPTPKKAEKAQVIVTATPSTIPAPVVAVSTPTPSCSEGMLRIPAGAYFLGSERSDPDRNNLIEADWQSAKLSDYCIDRFEYPNQEGMIPRTNVTWSQARDLCAKEQKRLCTETEWERACKGTENYRYPYGSNSDSKRCNTQAQKNLLIPSGTFASCKSSFGTLDMSGNAEEWVEESARFERMSRIAKGGSASLPVWAARCASLREYRASTTLNTLGFRCCKDFK